LETGAKRRISLNKVNKARKSSANKIKLHNKKMGLKEIGLNERKIFCIILLLFAFF